jgi:hypothetical protein
MAPRALTNEHKQAMAAGRKEGQAVKAYLDALEQQRPKRGRRRTAESMTQRLAMIESQLADASSLKRLQLIQERRDLQAELAGHGGEPVDLGPLEAGFVAVGQAYSQRKGISYAAWRELGVASDVLRKAGITRGA